MRRKRRRIWLLPPLLILCGLALFHTSRPAPEQEPELRLPPQGGPGISVLMADGSVQNRPLEEFLVGVVAAEMPASFAPEALKAQAIAARTYVLSHSGGRAPRHENADICCDSRHCQAYLSTGQLRERWGGGFDKNYRAICLAVSETAGQAIFYGGEPAETPYCSTCGGSTQAAADVWGKEVAYLQSVPCNWDAHSPRGQAFVELSLTEAAQRLNVRPTELAAMSASYGAGGAISGLSVGGKSFSGQELRQALALDSAFCQWLIEDDRVLFTTRGFGHGVGLCQYGADGMAQAGYTAAEILQHYYQGTQISAANP